MSTTRQPVDLELLVFATTRITTIGLPLIVFGGYLAGGVYTFAGFFTVFVFFSLLEMLLWASGSGTKFTPADELKFSERLLWCKGDGPIAVYAVLQVLAVVGILVTLRLRPFATFEVVGVCLSIAAMVGAAGGLGGHELVHRHVAWKRFLGTAVFACCSYGHFVVSHVHGHHKNVGLREDWGTARRDETFYGFWMRALTMGVLGSYRIEAKRTTKEGKLPTFLSNFMVRYFVFQTALVATIYLAFGLRTLVAFVAWSLGGTILFEMMNYLSHYGLERDRQDKHSWESNNKITNWFIFNGGKHSHHHRKPTHNHDDLMLTNGVEYLPFGVTAMTLLALCPPLYFRIMNPRLDRASMPTTPAATLSAP